MRLVTYNIHYGVGRDGHHDLDRIAAAVDGADVIALQEVERYWPRSGMVDQVQEMAKRLPEYWWVYGPNIDLHSEAGFPGEAAGRRRQFGNLLLSRTPILGSRHIPLPRAPGAPVSMARGAIEGVISTGVGPVRVTSTHLCYLSTATRLVQLQALVDAQADAAAGRAPWIGAHPDNGGWQLGDEPRMPAESIVLGDLNLSPDSAEYRRFIDADNATYMDAWATAGRSDAGATKDGERIDHCWVTEGLVPAVRWAWVDREAPGSDHQPAWYHLEL